MTPAATRTAAAVSVLGVLVLAGCGTADAGDAAPDAVEPAPSETTSPEPSSTGSATSSGAYVDGSYTAEGSYATPESVETISVTVTLEGDVITEVEVTGEPTKRESEQYQGQFIEGISDEVVGVSIDEISVSRVAGSSLTSGGFNEAIEQIKSDAAA